MFIYLFIFHSSFINLPDNCKVSVMHAYLLYISELDRHLDVLNKDLLRLEEEQSQIRQGQSDIRDILNLLPDGQSINSHLV